MPHIHTEPGQNDFVVDIFIVYQNKVLYRFHDKHHIWLVPGGHIELNEVPERAALREVKEEVGLDITLYQDPLFPLETKAGYEELLVPMAMNRHPLGNGHFHISLIYFATTETDTIIEPEGKEKSGGCIWLTQEEIIAHPDITPRMKTYGLKALELLAK